MDKKDTIIILGASGLVGNCLFKQLKKNGKKVIGTYNKNEKPGLVPFDLTRPSLKNILDKNAKYCIICSAITKLDECKKNSEYSNAVNIYGVKSLLMELSNQGVFPIFLSSGAVFDGIDGDYKEEDERRPISFYGSQKKEVEDFIFSKIEDYLIVRPGKIFGIDSEKDILFSNWLEKYKNREEIFCADDEKLSPTYVDDVALGIEKLLEKNARGVYHLNYPKSYSRFEMATNFFNYLGIDNAKIVRCSIDDFNFLEKRMKNSYLNADKFIKETKFQFTALEDIFKLFKFTKKGMHKDE